MSSVSPLEIANETDPVPKVILLSRDDRPRSGIYPIIIAGVVGTTVATELQGGLRRLRFKFDAGTSCESDDPVAMTDALLLAVDSDLNSRPKVRENIRSTIKGWISGGSGGAESGLVRADFRTCFTNHLRAVNGRTDTPSCEEHSTPLTMSATGLYCEHGTFDLLRRINEMQQYISIAGQRVVRPVLTLYSSIVPGRSDVEEVHRVELHVACTGEPPLRSFLLFDDESTQVSERCESFAPRFEEE